MIIIRNETIHIHMSKSLFELMNKTLSPPNWCVNDILTISGNDRITTVRFGRFEQVCIIHASFPIEIL